jgi:hypothetical protein
VWKGKNNIGFQNAELGKKINYNKHYFWKIWKILFDRRIQIASNYEHYNAHNLPISVTSFLVKS